MSTVSERLTLFRQLVSCVHNVTFSEFGPDFAAQYCSAETAEAIYLFLSIDGISRVEQMPELSQSRENDLARNTKVPIVCTNSLGMLWIAESEISGDTLSKIHVLGPVFPSDYSIQNIGNRMNELQLPLPLKREFLNFIDSLPIVPVTRIYEYGIMLHYCLYEEKITISDLVYRDNGSASEIPVSSTERLNAPGQTYLATKALMEAVSSGNLQYKEAANRLSTIGGYRTYLVGNNLLRQAKNSLIIFTSLCCQAAMAGGLPPATAYLLSDKYLQHIEDSTSMPSVAELSRTMLEDYILRVHRLKTETKISPQIQAVCDRIAIHPEEELDIQSLAAGLGYNDYYFSKKFKQETGVSIKEFALKQKIEKARVLLRSSTLTIQEIAETLGFHSQNYFGRQFKQLVGISPTEYRGRKL